MKASPNTVRIDSYLARLGYASRRKIDDFLKKNIVQVNNGKRVKLSGVRVNPLKDTIVINDEKIKQPTLVYYIVNKPKNVISTAADELGRKTVTSLVRSEERIFPVGRLDAESSGLVILTNDGELANKLSHPRFHTPKTYEVLIQDGIPQTQLLKLRNGIRLRDGKTAPADVEIVKHVGTRTLLKMTLYEGRNRQIRRMCGALGLNLVDLKRISIGPLELGTLKQGSYRVVTKDELQKLKQL